jgi:hypothetical protein
LRNPRVRRSMAGSRAASSMELSTMLVMESSFL